MNEQPHNQDPLDDLLRSARWDEPSAESLSRLAMHYRIERQKQMWRRTVRNASAVAAVFALATLAGVWWITSGTAPQENQTVADASQPIPPLPPVPDEAVKLDPYAGRPPTAAERAWLAMAERKRGRPSKPVADPIIEPLKSAAQAVADQPDLPPAVALCNAVGGQSRGNIEAALIRLLPTLPDTRRAAATRLLHEVASSRSLETYLQLFAVDETAEAALPGLLRWAPANTLVELIRAEQRPEWRLGLLAGLMERGTPQAVAAYLALCDDPKTQSDAYGALRQVQSPPYAALESYGAHGQMEMRFAAARVMGRLADGPMLERIASQLHDPATQQSALVALMSSERGRAAELLDGAARRIPTLISLRVTLESEALTTRTPVAQKTVYFSVTPDPT